MRIIVIIAVILLIAVIPIQSTGYSSYKNSSTNSYYNFTALSPGTFPSPNSIFNFAREGDSSGFNASIGPGVGMNGLLISSQHYGSWSAIRASLNSSGGRANITFEFSWNNHLSSSLTGNYITFSNGSSNLLNISFGPALGYGTRVSTANVTENIGMEPAMNALYRISMFIPANSSDSYVEILNNSFAGTVFPVIFPTMSSGILNNISISFGGQYCNLTLYNISYSNSFPGSLIYNSGSAVIHQKSYSSRESVAQYTNSSGKPLIFRNLNSVIYAGQSGSIYRFNYFNGTRSLIFKAEYKNNTTWISDGSNPSNAYFIISGSGSFTLITINLQNFSVKNATVNYTLPRKFILQNDGNFLLLTGYFGSVLLLNKSDPGIIYSAYVSGYSGNSTGSVLLKSRIRSSTEYLTYFRAANDTLLQCRLNLSTMHFASYRTTAVSPYNSGLTVLSYSANNTTIASLVELTSTMTDVIFLFSDSVVIPFTGNSTNMQISAGKEVIFSTSQGYFELPGNGTEQRTGLLAGSSQNLWFGGSYGLISVSGTITTFSLYNSTPYSSENISITGKSSYFVSGTGTLAFNVNSHLQYFIEVSFGNITTVLSNESSFQVYADTYVNGQYALSAIATNMAGYISYFNSTLYIDGGFPSLNTTLTSGGYVSNTTIVSYALNWSIGLRELNVTYLNSTYILNPGQGSFPLLTGNYSGPMKISMNARDNFGRNFTFNFSETVIWNNPKSFEMNLWNGEYLNSSYFTFKWFNLSYVTYYSINLSYNGIWNSIDVKTNHTALSLGNGFHSIALNAHLENGTMEMIGSANFTVVDYAPSIILSHSADAVYSFFGNSLNSTLYFKASGNVTSIVTVQVYSPSGKDILNESASDVLNITFSSAMKSLAENGRYMIDIKAVGLSNLRNSTQFEFLVNNTEPDNPVINGSSHYTNNGFVFVGYARYSRSTLVTENNGFLLPYSVNGNGSISLLNGTGTYIFTYTVYSNSMNYNTTMFRVYYYDVPPTINYSINSSTLFSTPDLSVNTAFADVVPISEVTFSYGNKTVVDNIPGYGGTYNLTFPKDGNYTVKVSVQDYCSNHNSTSFNVDVVYYPLLKSYHFRPLDFFIFQSFRAYLSGDRTSIMNKTWYVNGKSKAEGLSFLTSLPLGFSNVTLVVSNGNMTVSSSKTVFSTGPYLPAALIAALLVLVVYRRHSGSEDEEKISEFLGNCNGMKVKTIIKMASKSRLKRSSVEERMNELVDQNKASYALDPDGEKYFRSGK